MAGNLGKVIGSIAGGAGAAAIGLPPSIGASIGGNLGNKIGGGSNSSQDGMSDDNAMLTGTGLAKMLIGRRQQNKADSMMPQREDPEELAIQRYAARRKRAFQTGTATKAQRDTLASVMKTGIEKSFSAGQGMRGLNLMRRMFEQSMLGEMQQARQGEMQFAQMDERLTNKIADRSLQLQLLGYNREQARAAKTLTEGKSALNLAMARSIGVNPGDVNPEFEQPSVMENDV